MKYLCTVHSTKEMTETTESIMMNMYFFLFKEYHKNLLSLKSAKI